jgi:hypothetical protein
MPHPLTLAAIRALSDEALCLALEEHCYGRVWGEYSRGPHGAVYALQPPHDLRYGFSDGSLEYCDGDNDVRMIETQRLTNKVWMEPFPNCPSDSFIAIHTDGTVVCTTSNEKTADSP